MNHLQHSLAHRSCAKQHPSLLTMTRQTHVRDIAIRCHASIKKQYMVTTLSPMDSPVAKILRPNLLAPLTSMCLVQGLLPSIAQALEELSAQNADALASFFTYVESLGPSGIVVFILLVMTLEMVPLLPTQPLSLASGLLFGPFTGALVMLTGVSLAANNAFWISRGVGRKLAESIVKMETDDESDEPGKKPSALAVKINEVEAAIEAGGPVQQLLAVMFLRLTPVVPFSASNYILGLSPVLYISYIGGTVIGMSGWSVIYASLGAGARSLLDSGVDVPTLFADLADKAGSYSSLALKVSVVVGVVLLAIFYTRQAKEASR